MSGKVIMFPAQGVKRPGPVKLTGGGPSSGTMLKFPSSRPICNGGAFALDPEKGLTQNNAFGHFLPGGLSTTAAKIDGALTSEAIEFWGNYGKDSSDWVKPLLELPLHKIMGFLHVYHDEPSLFMSQGDAFFELALRIGRISEVNMEMACIIFDQISAYPDLPNQSRVFIHFNHFPELHSKVLAKKGVANGLRLLKEMERFSCPSDFYVARILFKRVALEEDERDVLKEIAHRYFKDGEELMFYKYAVRLEESVRGAVDLEDEAFHIKNGLSVGSSVRLGDPEKPVPPELTEEINGMWDKIAQEIAGAIEKDPAKLYDILQVFALARRELILARMLERGYEAEVLKYLDVSYERNAISIIKVSGKEREEWVSRRL